MRTALRLAAIVAVPLLVLAGAYDLSRTSREFSADGRPFLRLASGPAGGTWYPLGAKISQIFSAELPDVISANGPGGGVENVLDVNQRNAEMGFSYSAQTRLGYLGKGKFRHAQENIRHFATLYSGLLQIAVPRDSPVRSVADLRGRNISPGKAGWAGTEVARAVLKAYGMTFESIKQEGGAIHHVDYTDSVALMKDRHIDAFFALSSVPQSSLMELNFDPGIRLLSLDEDLIARIVAENPGYVRMIIPKTAYEGMQADVHTVGIPTVLIVHKDLPDDLVYRLAKAFWAHHADLVEVSPVWKDVRLENALLAPPAPVHPGAQRYYDENGVSLRD
jgi:TRAP transporter TAXI family solute receptor